jgi:diguanylate cyclase (GGDEF)-like protein
MEHILVVDDNKVNLVSAKNVLTGRYKVTAVTQGAQALKFLENNTVDLILLDKNMPEMDGMEVLQHLKENASTAALPVVFLTSENDSLTEAKCIEEGAVDFIPKPFVPNVMLTRIARIIEQESFKRVLAKKLEEKTLEASDMKSKSYKDALTDLWNRAYTEEAVNELIAEDVPGAFFMMDMDNFKAINDNYGHIAGDQVLKMFADTLREHFGKEDIICRIGGDEFVAFVPGNKSKEELGNIASDIISDIVYKLKELKFDTNTSVSIGITQTPDDGECFEELYNAADKSLYYVKQNGKNSFHFYSENHANEQARASRLIDLSYIKEIMSRSDPDKGAYLMDFESFRHVYNFIRRFVERNNHEVQTILFTLIEKAGAPESTDEMELALDMLDQAIFTSLRRMDVSTRYSSRQVIVILLDTNSDNADIVAGRIMEAFKKLYLGDLIYLEYEMVPLEGRDS